MEEEKKLTTKEILEILVKNFQEMRKDLDLIKDKKEEKQIGESVKNLIKQQGDSGFLLEGNIKFFKLPDYPASTQKEDFFKELQKLMIKYKVHFCLASLIKRF